MTTTVIADDGLLASVVKEWAKEKHELLCSYVQIASATRKKYLPPDNRGGAAYIDLFCGHGRSLIKDTTNWIDGGAVAAWKKSVASNSPFTRMIIADADEQAVAACEARLKVLGANVVATCGPARETAFWARQRTPVYGLNFAFLDPYSLEALDFRAIEELAKIARIDMLVHVSAMDLQRNLDPYLAAENSAFDAFAPGWRDRLEFRSKQRTREDLVSYWRELVAGTGVWASEDVRLVKGTRGQRLYWLLLAAGHDLAHRFWKAVVARDGQGSLDI